MMVLNLESARQDRPGWNPNWTRLEFKNPFANPTAKMMVMTPVRRFKMRFLPRQQDLNDRSGLTQQTNRAVNGCQTQSRHARTAALENRSNVQWTFCRLDDLENRLALPGVALCWRAGHWRVGVHGPRISPAK
jgi:hypothetical protein